jgi:2-amino-4-hydroxy-6-hydroxymethyldihydropteridine diphosphokinase
LDRSIFVAFGANIHGSWGPPAETFSACLARFEALGFHVKSRSSWYETAPIGRGMRPNYVNGAVEIETGAPPHFLLNLLKKIEKDAGRRHRSDCGDRPLDLDILDYKGVMLNWDIAHLRVVPAVRGTLILPHARLHLRPFVLAPLNEIAEGWRHPVLRLSLRALLERTKRGIDGQIIGRL